MSDIREKLMEVIANRTAPNAADAILAAGWTPPTVKPPVEALADALMAEGIDAEPGELDLIPLAERLLAMLPGRTEAEVKAEELRVAAIYAPGGPVVSGWLRERADQWEEANRD